jgi:drug/metabolite transporter (DMT)-like permease
MWRSLLAGVVAWALLRPRRIAPWRMDRLTWAVALSYALMLVTFVSATKLTTAANAIFLQYTAPLYVVLVAFLWLRERPAWLDIATVAVAFAGMALFFVGRLEADDLGGNALAIFSGMCFASMLTLLRAPSCTPDTRAEAMFLGNGMLVLGLAAVNVTRREWGLFTPGAGDIAALVYLGLFQIGLAYVVFVYGMARVSALEASLIGMLEPVLNPVWVFIVLGENPGWWAVLGGAVIVAAVTGRTAIVERKRDRHAPQPALFAPPQAP